MLLNIYISSAIKWIINNISRLEPGLILVGNPKSQKYSVGILEYILASMLKVFLNM